MTAPSHEQLVAEMSGAPTLPIYEEAAKKRADNRAANAEAIARNGALRDYVGRMPAIPCIVVASGPSLTPAVIDRDIGPYRDKAVIFACLSAVKPLLDRDVVPHAVMFYDHDPLLHRLPLWSHGTTSFLEEGCHPEWWRLRSRNKIVFRRRIDWTKTLDDDGEIAIPQAPTVAGQTMVLARVLGFNPIVFAGLDLAFTGGQVHAKGHFQGGTETPKSVGHREYYEHADINGAAVETSWDFLMQRAWMKQWIDIFKRIASTGNIPCDFINATGAGIGLPGAQDMPMSAALSGAKVYGDIDNTFQSVVTRGVGQHDAAKRDVHLRNSARLPFELSERPQRNIVLNKARIIRTPYADAFARCFADLPAVVVSSGPSVDATLPKLARYRDRAVVVATAGALGPLGKHKIVPDVVVVFEPHPLPNFRKVWDSRVFKAVEYHADPFWWSDELPSRGTFCFSRYQTEFIGRLNTKLGRRTAMNANACTAAMIFSVARLFGCSPVCLLGFDFCFADAGARLHSKDYRMPEDEQREIHGWYHGSQLLDTTDVHGNPIRTSTVLAEARAGTSMWVRSHIKAAEFLGYPVEVLNCSEAGMGLFDVPNVTLESVLDSRSTLPKMPADVLLARSIKGDLQNDVALNRPLRIARVA